MTAPLPLARYLDAAVLKPETTRDEAVAAIKKCLELETATVCVRPCDIALAQELCAGSNTGVCVVLGFPHGCGLTAGKVAEAQLYVDAGVDEIDMVANYGWAKSGRWDDVEADIAAVTAVTRPAGVPLKVIFETSQLDLAQVARLTEASITVGADFVKTSTGFNGSGATEEAVEMMLKTAAGRIKVKPSGGIRDAVRAQRFVDLGVDRLGVNWASCEAIISGATPADGQGY